MNAFEKQCKFNNLKFSYCKKCNRKVLHEYGQNTDTGEKVKQCIFCRKTTIIGRRKRD